MATKQEKPGVELHFIDFLADDNAPDAESAYVFWGSATLYGTLIEAKVFAKEEVKRLRLCGYKIRINHWNGEVIEEVIGNFSDPDDEYQGSYHDYDD